MIDPASRWQSAVASVETALRAWRADHPRATLTEIEQALDTRLDLARAALLAEVAGDVPQDEARCPECGGALVGRGVRTRTLRAVGDAPLALTRAYLRCPACGAGVFPPR
jgi:ribosomal protein S27AE